MFKRDRLRLHDIYDVWITAHSVSGRRCRYNYPLDRSILRNCLTLDPTLKQYGRRFRPRLSDQFLSACATIMMHLFNFSEEWSSGTQRISVCWNRWWLCTVRKRYHAWRKTRISQNWFVVRPDVSMVRCLCLRQWRIPLAYNKDMQEDRKNFSFDAMDTVKVFALFNGMLQPCV